MTLRLYTNRYQEFHPDQGVPVRITVGAPRFRLPYSIDHRVHELAPTRKYLRWPREEFEVAFRAQLDRIGLASIERRLRAIATLAESDDLVLLCFEDLTKPGQWCHRRMVAAWWTERTGQGVPELGGPEHPGFEQLPIL